jgi:tripartite-type tricarboxylate transporter receptor subunit TctC
MNTMRRRLLLASATWSLAGVAKAQGDAKAIKFLVGFAAGGGTDAVARVLADKLKDVLEQPVIVENMAGAGGRLAANALVAAPPDGLTYMVANNAVHTFQTLVFGSQLKWHYRRDFAPVAQITSYPLALAVGGSLGVNNVAEYVKLMRAKPDQATFGTAGLGGQAHFSGVQFAREADIKLEPVAYKGATPMVTDLVGGHLPAGISLMDDMLKFHRAGNLKVIGVFSEQRSPVAPDIPTFVEQGYKDLYSESWQGIWAPAKTPQAQIDRMQNAVKKVLEMPDVRQTLTTRLYVVPTFRPAVEMARLQDEEIRRWEPIIKSSGFKPE